MNTAPATRIVVVGAGFAGTNLVRALDGKLPGDCLLTLVSGLAPHFRALRDRPDCALMLGEVGEKGDPLTHPRLMIRARASFIAPDDPARPGIRDRWLARNPKATVYIDLPDFAFVRLTPTSALLNGGFARAFHIRPEDL